MKFGTARFARTGCCLLAAMLGSLPGASAQTLGGGSEEPALTVVKLRPQVRSEALSTATLSAQQRQALGAFLSLPQVFEPEQAQSLPLILGGQGQRSLFTLGDTIYVRSPGETALLDEGSGSAQWNIYSEPKALKDPVTGAVLGLEGQYVGRARLRSGEQRVQTMQDGKPLQSVVPAVFEIVHAVAEIRAGDRLFQLPPGQWREFSERPAPAHIAATVVSIYGTGVANASKNQIVVLNQGSAQGLQAGHVMAFGKRQSLPADFANPAQALLAPAAGVSGQALVFLTFDKLSYALVGEVSEPVQVGDRLRPP